MRIVVVGSNPSQKSPDTTAFSPRTQSGKRVREWLSCARDVCFVNISDEPTANNRPLSKAEIESNLLGLREKLLNADRIVTVGKAADQAVSALRLQHLALPHPSGRCRQLNDIEFVRGMLSGLRAYLLEE